MLKKVLLVSALFLSFLFTVFPQEKSFALSKNAVISLITMEPSSKPDNYYGHSALRVYDEENDIDELFNLGFKKNGLSYKNHSRFIDAVNEDIRTYSRNWTEQELNMTHEQKQKMFELLILSCNGPYYGYRNDFLTENSTTKIFSLLKLILNENLEIVSGKHTYRSVINNDFISRFDRIKNNILLGSNSDINFKTEDVCFTPELLKIVIEKSNIIEKTQKRTPLLINFRSLVDVSSEDSPLLSDFTVKIIFFILLAFIFSLTVLQVIFNSKSFILKSFTIAIKSFELLILVFTGFLGILVLFNNFFSTFVLSSFNYNFIWLFPANFICAFFTLKNTKNLYISVYWIILFVMNVTFTVLSLTQIIPQTQSLENYIFISMLSIRYLYHALRFIPFKIKMPVLNQEPAVLN